MNPIAEVLDQSVQEHRPSAGLFQELGLWFLGNVQALAAYEIADWGTARRLRQQRHLFYASHNTLVVSALTDLIRRVKQTPWEIAGPERQAKKFQRILQQANFGAGFDVMISKVLQDYLTLDCGAYVEIIAPGTPDTAITMPVTGVASLDALRCYPTDDPEHPVLYYSHVSGQLHKLHRTRVVRIIDMPSPDPEHISLGMSSLSRALSVVYAQMLMLRHQLASLDDVPMTGVATITGVSQQKLMAATEDFYERGASDSTDPLRNLLVLKSADPKELAKFELTSFSNLPDGFKINEAISWHVNMTALAIGVDPQDLWPLSGAPLGSGQQSQVLHQKGKGRAIGDIYNLMVRLFNLSVLPLSCKFEYKTQDTQQSIDDANRASAWSSVAAQTVAAGLMTAAQGQQLAANTIPEYADVMLDERGLLRLPDSDVDDESDAQLNDAETPSDAPDTDEAQVSDEKAYDPDAGFVYIPIPDNDVVLDIMRAQREAVLGDAEWVPPSQYHITLCYSQNIPAEAQRWFARILEFSPTAVDVDSIEVFENGDERALHIQLIPSPALSKLQQQIYDLVADGYPVSEYSQPDKYTPHITIAYLAPNATFTPIYPAGSIPIDQVRFGRDNYEPVADVYATQMKALADTQSQFIRDWNDLVQSARDGSMTRRRFGTIARAMIARTSRRAFEDGLRDGGVDPADMSDEDRADINAHVMEQSIYVTQLGEAVFRTERVTDALAALKGDLWWNKSIYPAYTKGLRSADKNGYYAWQLGATEDHCEDCLRFSMGHVHRLRDWIKSGYIPKAEKLACGGWRCDCRLEKTDGPARGGRINRKHICPDEECAV